MCRRTPGHQAHRTPVPEPDATQEEKAADLVHPESDIAARGEVQQTPVPVVRGPGGPGEGAQDDRCAGENVVPEQTHQMEVSKSRVGVKLLFSSFFR